jgi:hypothetical protein
MKRRFKMKKTKFETLIIKMIEFLLTKYSRASGSYHIYLI